MGRLPTESDARAVLIDAQQPKRVYAATGNSLYRSDDAGQTWQEAGRGLVGGVEAMALDARQPQRLYAATRAGALYVSEDGASTWQPLLGAESDASR